MPDPVVEPSPPADDERRPPAPLLAHDASYFAASASSASLRDNSIARRGPKAQDYRYPISIRYEDRIKPVEFIRPPGIQGAFRMRQRPDALEHRRWQASSEETREIRARDDQTLPALVRLD